MNTLRRLLVCGLIWCAAAIAAQAQAIPEKILGKWKVTKILPTRTISCWGDAEAKALIGTEIEYAADSLRWKNHSAKSLKVTKRVVPAQQFHDENSGHGRDGSEVTLAEIGIKAERVVLISIGHAPAEITSATTEIPGDEVLIKGKDLIVFSVCNIYFEAVREAGK